MTLTVAELCRMTDPPLVPVAGLAGLANRVNWVIATDHLNPKRWLRGGEFNLISGWNLGNDAREMVLYLDRLYSSGVSGIGFGVGLKFDAVPQPLIERADILQLPLCEVPYDLSFSKITQVAAESIFARQVAKQGLFLKNRIIEDAVEERITLFDVAVRISNTLVSDVCFVDRYEGVIAQVSSGQAALKQMDFAPDDKEWTVFPCTGHVTLAVYRPAQDFSESENAFISEMIFAARIIVKRETALLRERTRLQTDLLHEIAVSLHTPEELARKFAVWGLEPAKKYMVAAVSAGAGKEHGILDAMRQHMPANVLLGIESSRVVAIVPVTHGQTDIAAMLEAVAADRPDVTIGISAVLPIERLSAAMKQADALSRLRGAGVRSPADMNVESLLMLIDPAVSGDFAASVLTEKLPLELRETIGALLERGFNVNQTAAALKLHRHTLKNRIERFSDITGIDITIPDNRNKAWLALTLVRLLDGVK